MASRAFEIWLITTSDACLIQTHKAYAAYLARARLINKPVEDWITENFDLIRAQLAIRESNGKSPPPVPAPEGVNQLHPASGAYLRHVRPRHRKDKNDDRGVCAEAT